MAKKTIKFDFNPDLFNEIYWHILRAIRNPLIRFIWAFGGSSASKTFSVVQAQIILMLEEKNQNALVMRKVGADILDSIYSDFKNIITDLELTRYFTIQQNYIRCNLTGSFVRFRGMDATGKIKGITGFKRVIMEEVDQFDEVDFKQVRKRLRGMKGQQIIALFNPISEEHWIKKNVFDLETLIEEPTTDMAGKWINDKGNTVIMKTNYLYNYFVVGKFRKNEDGGMYVDEDGQLQQIGGFVDQHTIDDFEKDKIQDNNYYQIYGLGNWGRIRVGGEFWKDFNTNIHLTDIGWQKAYPLHITWDENVNPWLTCLVWQLFPEENKIMPGKKLAIQIDEICLEDPNNRIPAICKHFQQRYPQNEVAGLFVYGDRTSLKEDAKLEKGENFFTLILTHLSTYKPRLRVPSCNPSVWDSAGFINHIYAGFEPIWILINRKCKKSVHDYEYALEDSDGTLKIVKKKHPITEVTYEEYGHPSDAKRYLITVAYQNEYSIYLRGGHIRIPKVGKAIAKHSY